MFQRQRTPGGPAAAQEEEKTEANGVSDAAAKAREALAAADAREAKRKADAREAAAKAKRDARQAPARETARRSSCCGCCF